MISDQVYGFEIKNKNFKPDNSNAIKNAISDYILIKCGNYLSNLFFIGYLVILLVKVLYFVKSKIIQTHLDNSKLKNPDRSGQFKNF